MKDRHIFTFKSENHTLVVYHEDYSWGYNRGIGIIADEYLDTYHPYYAGLEKLDGEGGNVLFNGQNGQAPILYEVTHENQPTDIPFENAHVHFMNEVPIRTDR